MEINKRIKDIKFDDLSLTIILDTFDAWDRKRKWFFLFSFWKIDIFDECIWSEGFSIYKENLNIVVKIWDSDKRINLNRIELIICSGESLNASMFSTWFK